MAGWTALVWAAGLVVFVPITSTLLGWSAFPGAGGVVGNQDLVDWVLSVPGLTWVVAAGALVLTGTAVRYAGLFRIVSDDLAGRRPTLVGTVLSLAPRVPDLLRLCAAVVLGGAVLSLPLGAGLWVIKEAFLGLHDVNYYLAVRPPAWEHALTAAVSWTVLWLLGATWVVGRSLLTLPAWVDGHRSLWTALRWSWRRSRGGRGGRALRSVALAVALWVVARSVLDAGILSAASAGLERLAVASDSLRLLAAGSAAALGISIAVDAVVDFLGFSTVATVLTKVYYEDTRHHARARQELPGLIERGSGALEGIGSRVSPGRIALLAGGLVAASLVGGAVLMEGLSGSSSVAVVAHRGGPAPAPENTLAALDLAVEAGADYSEIDVQRSRDGTVVVAHDADLMRVAGDPRRIRTQDWSELREVVKVPSEASGARIPREERRLVTLGEFLERARGRIGVEIELKYYGRDTALVPAVIREVRRRGMADRVAIMSLDLEAIRTVHRLAPEIRTGYAAAVSVGDLSALAVDFLTVARQRATPGLLRAAHDRGLAVHAWTVNRESDMAELIRRGVDGLVTDHPRVAVQVRREMDELPAAARLLLRFQPFRLDEGG